MQITQDPAIIRSAEGSVDLDGIHCLFDNVKRTLLERWLLAKYGMTAKQYREYCSLPADYPMHAPVYATEKMQIVADRIETLLAPEIAAISDADRRRPAPGISNSPEIVRAAKGSVTDKLIYCLFDGEGHSNIMAHVSKKYGMRWEEYLAFCGLSDDYPMIAPFYSGDRTHLDS